MDHQYVRDATSAEFPEAVLHRSRPVIDPVGESRSNHEVFAELATLLGRRVPESEREARTVLGFYRTHGPLPRQPFLAACARTAKSLGTGRPLAAYLADLERTQPQVLGATPESACGPALATATVDVGGRTTDVVIVVLPDQGVVVAYADDCQPVLTASLVP